MEPMRSFIYYVEVSGFCNLRCPSCPNGNYEGAHPQPKGYMPLDLFKSILEKIVCESPGSETRLYLFNWGEPTLHPELPQMIELARRFGLGAHLSSNLVAPKNLRDIVKARPASLRVSLSGYFPATYARTHAQGDAWRMVANAYRLRAEMDSLGVDFPVEFFYHKYLHNMGADFKKVADLAKDLRFSLIAFWAQFFPVEKMLGYLAGRADPADRPVLDCMAVKPEEYRTVALAHRAAYPDCGLRSHQMCIDFDGSVSLCCAAYDRAHFLEGAFLEHPHEWFQEQKYRHSLCLECRREGCDVAYVYGGLEDLNTVALSRI